MAAVKGYFVHKQVALLHPYKGRLNPSKWGGFQMDSGGRRSKDSIKRRQYGGLKRRQEFDEREMRAFHEGFQVLGTRAILLCPSEGR